MIPARSDGGPLWLNMTCAIPADQKNHTVALLFALFSVMSVIPWICRVLRLCLHVMLIQF
jgi:hypothetical protein